LQNSMKQRIERKIIWEITNQCVAPVDWEEETALLFVWHEKNRRRDKDNIAFGKKFILDALVQAGILSDDGWRYVNGFQDTFLLAKGSAAEGVEVTLYPVRVFEIGNENAVERLEVPE